MLPKTRTHMLRRSVLRHTGCISKDASPIEILYTIYTYTCMPAFQTRHTHEETRGPARRRGERVERDKDTGRFVEQTQTTTTRMKVHGQAQIHTHTPLRPTHNTDTDINETLLHTHAHTHTRARITYHMPSRRVPRNVWLMDSAMPRDKSYTWSVTSCAMLASRPTKASFIFLTKTTRCVHRIQHPHNVYC
jgi:hypothetical protein